MDNDISLFFFLSYNFTVNTNFSQSWVGLNFYKNTFKSSTQKKNVDQCNISSIN